jgi:hypothetical protein
LDATGGAGTGSLSEINFDADDALLNLDCGLSDLSLNYVEVSVNVDYMLWDANTISCGSVSFPSSGTSSRLYVYEADSMGAGPGSWKIIDTASSSSPGSSFGYAGYSAPDLSNSWSNGDLFLDHS